MNPQSVYERLTKVNDRWKDTEEAANLLEAAQKSMKARMTIYFRDKGMSMAEAEVRAIATSQYQESQEAAIRARAAAHDAKLDVDAAKAFIDAWRTCEASERFAMKTQV